jgi:hypothetical protein
VYCNINIYKNILDKSDASIWEHWEYRCSRVAIQRQTMITHVGRTSAALHSGIFFLNLHRF